MPIIVKNLTYIYNKKTTFAKKALDDVCVTINDGEIIGVIGQTGSGKSTFVQHLNGLIKLQSGSVIVDDIDLTSKKVDLMRLRSKVGMVFQYPEYQLFANTVEEDIGFGPKNFKLTKPEIAQLVKSAINLVGLDYDTVKDKSPFDLSGGERRRVALAGVLVMNPSIIVLDEPTAGLDPQGKLQILQLVRGLNASGSTIIMVSHDMNEIYENTSRVLLFDNGRIVKDCSTEQMFENPDNLSQNLEMPAMAQVKYMLAQKGIVVKGRNVQEVYKSIIELVGVKNA
ncbi:MAG: energy-coupling factor transporter ATPase [Clostridia bacterium]